MYKRINPSEVVFAKLDFCVRMSFKYIRKKTCRRNSQFFVRIFKNGELEDCENQFTIVHPKILP